MNQQLNELKNHKNSIDTMNKEQQQEWYLRIKESLSELTEIGMPEELRQAIKTYEQNNGIV